MLSKAQRTLTLHACALKILEIHTAGGSAGGGAGAERKQPAVRQSRGGRRRRAAALDQAAPGWRDQGEQLSRFL